MSHISRIKTQLVDEELLLKALADLEVEVVVKTPENPSLTVRGMGAEKASVDIKATTRLGGEIGFRKTANAFEMVADWWRVIGVKKEPFLQQVTQRYAYHAAISKLTQQGFSLVEEQVETRGKEKGQIRILLRRSV